MKNIFKNIISYIIQTEARLILKKYQPKIVAVTGSVGKTSTKDAIYSVMSKSFHVRKSEKSFNSEIGVPLTILGCQNAWNNPFKWLQNIYLGLTFILQKKAYPEWLVLEIGADRPGDIEKLSSWIKPDVVVVTKFAKVPVHIEYFKSREQVIAEKGHLVTALKHDGVLILNSDDEDVFAFKNKVSNKILTYGLMGDSQVRATNYSVYYNEETFEPFGVYFKVEHAGNCLPVKIIGTLGYNNIYSSLAAIAVGLSLNLNLVEVTESLSQHVSPRGRMNLIKGINKSTIIDDTYNSSPVALASALDTLKNIKTKGRRIAVLGDMMELGKHTAEEHHQAGILAATTCDFLVTVGLRSKMLAESALDAGLSEKNILQFDTATEAGEYVRNIIQENDVILVKGSQSTRMEKVVKAIMAEPEKSSELLVRQDEEWLSR
ncbi:MAG: UDP-N-acetylmuramoyl-tripeptide--D-alanyl-D-alanine ligase [Candidatus Paceibacterota bacterium]